MGHFSIGWDARFALITALATVAAITGCRGDDEQQVAPVVEQQEIAHLEPTPEPQVASTQQSEPVEQQERQVAPEEVALASLPLAGSGKGWRCALVGGNR